MNVDFLQERRIDGYPAFVCRADDGEGVVWWAPVRSGDPTIDYAAGAAHFETALKLAHSLRVPEFMRLVTMIGMEPVGVFTHIVAAMTATGPIERGFLASLARQAIAGRLPPLTEDDRWSEEDRLGEAYAHDCIELARSSFWPEVLTDDLISAIDLTFTMGTPGAFIWTVCRAATAGGLH